MGGGRDETVLILSGGLLKLNKDLCRFVVLLYMLRSSFKKISLKKRERDAVS